MHTNSPLVSVKWLFENLQEPKLIIIDASLKNPIKGNSHSEIGIIPKALLFDWDRFSDLASELSHTMPTEQQFVQSARDLGINNNSIIVIYDRAGVYSSARVWWMFRAMGFNAFVLDGGLPEWLKSGYACVKEYAKPKQIGDFNGIFNEDLFSSKSAVRNAINDPDTVIIDARNADRFNGKSAEPRAGLRAGHIPTSLNIPFETVIAGDKLRSAEELEQIFSTIKDKDMQLIFSCGSGITACIDGLAATIIGYQKISIYDGSWSEWGQDLTCPIA